MHTVLTLVLQVKLQAVILDKDCVDHIKRMGEYTALPDTVVKNTSIRCSQDSYSAHETSKATGNLFLKPYELYVGKVFDEARDMLEATPRMTDCLL
jgi:hypothetical protein